MLTLPEFSSFISLVEMSPSEPSVFLLNYY